MLPKSPLARMLIYGAVASVILTAAALSVDWFPPQGSRDANRIDTLYNVLLICSVPIFVLVMTVAIYSVIRFRARPGDTGDGAPIHGHAQLEVVWVVIPFVMVSVLAGYAWITLHDIEKRKKGEMTVNVTGQQFEWHFAYPGPGGRQVQSNVLYLPLGKPVRFKIRTKDVIHSFWIPDFRLKEDAVPGITTDWRATPTKAGVHDVVCAELCGPGHALMRGTVRVVSPRTFTAWLTKKGGTATTAATTGAKPGAKPAAGAAAGQGKQVFASNGCSGCHTLAAAGATGKVGPDLDNVVADAGKYAKGKPAADYIRQSIVAPDAFVVPGFPKGTMPKTFGQQLSPQQLDALVQFLLQSGGGRGGKTK